MKSRRDSFRKSRRNFLKYSVPSTLAFAKAMKDAYSVAASGVEPPSYPVLNYEFIPRKSKSRFETLAQSTRLEYTVQYDDHKEIYFAGARMPGDRLLILHAGKGSKSDRPSALKTWMESSLDLKVTVKNISDYKPAIDEYAYDGFIYLGEDYSVMPSQPFLNEIVRTNKPVLWANYHGWRLDKGIMAEKNMSIKDVHSQAYTIVDFRGFRDLAFTDTVQLAAAKENTLYDIIDPAKRQRMPGAAHSGNFTYVSYLPSVNPQRDDFLPFLAALQQTFGIASPVKSNGRLTYGERISAARQDKLKKGIILPLYVRDSAEGDIGYDSDAIHQNLVRIRRSGANWVSVVQLFYQDHRDSSSIYADPKKTPSFDSIADLVEDAHDLGLNVLLKADVNINPKTAAKGDWSGNISPKDPEQWWKSYFNLILQMAEFSKDHEVESLGIGLELTAMEGLTRSWYPEYNSNPKYADKWRSLIKEVRGKYDGLVTYQANFDVFEVVPWVDDLDYYGIAAYFPLSKHPNPRLEDLRAGWKEPIGRINRWAKDHPDLPFEILEIGYASQPNTSIEPFMWSPYFDAALDLEEQKLCFESLYETVRDTPAVRGVHYFASLPGEPDPTDRRYMIYGKPAQEYMEKVFRLVR